MSFAESLIVDASNVNKPNFRGYLHAREIVSILDVAFGGLDNDSADNAAAIEAAHQNLLNRNGGDLFFPLADTGKYRVSREVLPPNTAPAMGITWRGQGNACGSSAGGVSIKYTGAANADKAVVNFTGGTNGWISCGIDNIELDANSLAGYALHVDAWSVTAYTSKGWSFNRVGFSRGTRALVVIGQATFSAGDFVAATNDLDAHLISFERCLFAPMATTMYGIVFNVNSNNYQNSLHNCSFEGTSAQLAAMVNYVFALSTNSVELHDCFFSPLPLQTANVACVRQFNGSMLIMGGGSEEGRVLLRSNLAAAFNSTTIIGFNVNDPTNMVDTTKKKSINDISGSPMLLLNNIFATGGVSREIKSASSNFTAIGNQVGAAAVWTNCAPSDEFIGRTFNAAHYTANGSMTWTLAAGDVTTFVYKIIGRHMYVKWLLSTTTPGGVANTALQILIPAGKVAAKAFFRPFHYYNNAAEGIGVATVADGGTVISLFKSYNAVVNWTLETNLTNVFGDIDFEIDP